jgi:hypothetical protein
MAAGDSVAKFAEQGSISARTCYGWTHDAGFPDRVARHRARITDRIIGQLVRPGRAAIRRVDVLAKNAENESARLAANRAILSDLIAVSNFVRNDADLQELKQKVEAI